MKVQREGGRITLEQISIFWKLQSRRAEAFEVAEIRVLQGQNEFWEKKAALLNLPAAGLLNQQRLFLQSLLSSLSLTSKQKQTERLFVSGFVTVGLAVKPVLLILVNLNQTGMKI